MSNYDLICVAGISGDTTLCKDGMLISAHLYNHSAFSKRWSTGSVGNEITALLPGRYSLTVLNECGTAETDIHLHGCRAIVAFPNAFSPNGDGKNDAFRPIVQDIGLLDEFVIRIFNRWGQLMFVSTEPDAGWDGSGMDMGTYFYLCRYKEKGRNEEIVKGTLELIR